MDYIFKNLCVFNAIINIYNGMCMSTRSNKMYDYTPIDSIPGTVTRNIYSKTFCFDFQLYDLII